MITEIPRESAKIYQFPARGRATSGSHRQGAKAAADLASALGSKAISASGWYHEAAVQEAAQDHKG